MPIKRSRYSTCLVALLATLVLLAYAPCISSAENNSRMEQIFSILEETTSDPQTLADYDRLATMAFARGDYEQALVYIDECIALVSAGDTASLGALWAQKGVIWARMQDADKALEALDKAAEYTPQNLQMMLLRAELYMGRNEPRRAIGEYKQYLSLLPEDSAVWSLLADAQSKAGENQDAKESRRKAEELSQIPENEILSQARNEYLNGNFDTTVEKCSLYLESMEDATGSVHFLRGAAHMQADRQEEAIEDLNEALALGYSDEAVLYEFLSSCYFILGKYDKVLETGAKSIAVGSDVPAYDTLYQRMGVSAMVSDRYDEAVGYFEKSMEANGSLIGNYYYRAMCHMATEQYEVAIADFTESINRGELVQRCLYNRGVCNVQIDAFDEGISDLEATLKIKDDPELVENANAILWQLALYYMSEEAE